MSKTILCADDSVTMQTVAKITFSSEEYEYVGATSADEAIAAARDNKPALMLIDVGMGGYELCETIKRDDSFGGYPIVMMCGNSEAYNEALGTEAGVDGHVTKPWDTEKMLKQINSLLEAAAGGVAKPTGPAKEKKQPAPVAAVAASAPLAASPSALAAAAAGGKGKAADPRSMTLMGMPAVDMAPGAKPAPAEGTSPGSNGKAAKKEVAPPAANMSRPSMVTAVPTKRLSFAAYARKATPDELAAARASAQKVAADAGHSISDSEAGAILKLSADIVERIVWECVPDLAEVIIRENLEKLAAK